MNRSVVRAVLVGTRVILFDIDDARRLFAQGFYGKPLGIPKPESADFSVPLELSLLEALYLYDRGLLDIVGEQGEGIGRDKLVEIGRRFIENFDDLYIVYRDLRDKGFIVRSGLKYGADFALYTRRPGEEHAPYLVYVVGYHEKIDPLEIVRAGRISHSVRKRFLIAAVNRASGAVTYIMFKWSKP